jgi:hypothetical protein
VTNCHDVREWAGARTSREFSLTELALLEVHLRQCAECRELVSPRRMSRSREAVTSLAELLRCGWLRSIRLGHAARLAGGVRDTARAGIVRVAILRGRLRALGPIPLTLTARPGGGVAETLLVRTRRYRLGSTPLARAASTAADTPSAVLINRARIRDTWVRLRGRLSVPLSTSAPVVGLGLLAALTFYALHGGPALQLEERREATSAATPAQPAAEPTAGPPTAAAVEVSTALESPSPRIAAQKPEPARARGPALKRTAAAGAESARKGRPSIARASTHPAASSPDPARRRKPAMAHVAGRLSVKHRHAIEKNLTALLARTGGTLLGTEREGTVTFVDAVVPEASYQQFTRGLTRLGSWSVEAERLPLPEDVHLTIRVGG